MSCRRSRRPSSRSLIDLSSGSHPGLIGAADDEGMETHTRREPKPLNLVEVVRVLVLVQGAILVASTLESALFMGFVGPIALPGVIVTGLFAGVTLATAAGLGRRARWARRLTIVAEVGVFLGGLVDLTMALLMTHALLGLVPLLTRLVAPAAVIVLLRRRAVRASFVRIPPPPVAEVPALEGATL